MGKTKAYCRVSTEKQTDGAGLQQQSLSISSYAAASGISIDEIVYEDESGTVEDREEIVRLLREAEAGELTLLLVDRVDRLGRTLVICESLVDRFKKAGCEVRFTTLNLGTSPESVLLRQLLGSIAEFQRTTLVKHLTACKRAKARRTGTHTGIVPTGYKRGANDIIVEDEVEAVVVRRIFALSRAGFSMNAIARQLTREGFTTRGGGQYYPMQVRRVLSLEKAYRGQESFCGPDAPVVHQGLI
jgi:DNA invertase Pin-like site-specific DNA recombinase